MFQSTAFFKPQSTPAPAGVTMQVDFGRNLAYLMSPFPWNNFATNTSPANVSGTANMTGGETITGLTDTNGNTTSLSLEITSAFDGYDANTVANNELYVSTAARDCWRTGRDISATIQLQNCDPAKVYDFTFFASRGFIGDTTIFTIGLNSVNINHKDEAAGSNTGNVTTTATITGVSPDSNNNIDIDVEGFNRYGFINVLEITER